MTDGGRAGRAGSIRGVTEPADDAIRDLAERYTARQLDERATALESAGDAAGEDLYRRAFMFLEQRELVEAQRRLDRRLREAHLATSWRTYRDEGVGAYALTVDLPPRMFYWIREGDLGYELLVDGVEPPSDGRPSAFARRTVRVFPRTEIGIRSLERLVLAQSLFSG